jgi:hypothetical protein
MRKWIDGQRVSFCASNHPAQKPRSVGGSATWLWQAKTAPFSGSA